MVAAIEYAARSHVRTKGNMDVEVAVRRKIWSKPIGGAAARVTPGD